MAYQNVGTPRFYINEPLWLLSNNAASITNSTDFPDNIFNLNPTTQYTHTGSTEQDHNIHVNLTNGYNYIAWLGHNFFSSQFTSYALDELGATITPTGGINYSGETSGPTNDGFTFQFFDQSSDFVDINFQKLGTTTTVGKCSSISVGRFFDMPHSPDLMNLTMTREYGGIKTIETKGGASLSNDFGSSPPNWGNAAAWELWVSTPANQKLARSGRRVWDLSFSYIQDSDIFPEVSNLNALESLSPEGLSYETDLDPTGNTLLDDPNFYSQVIHKTNGQLPFIFQPDNSNFNPDQFAICKFDSGFSFQQTAPNLYSVRMKIREVW